MITVDDIELKRVTEIKFDDQFNLILRFHFDERMNDCMELSKLMKFDLKQVYKSTPEDVGVFQVKIKKEYDINIETP